MRKLAPFFAMVLSVLILVALGQVESLKSFLGIGITLIFVAFTYWFCWDSSAGGPT